MSYLDRKARFEDFDRDNPEVYALFVRFALEALRAGRDRYRAHAIIERIRRHTSVETMSRDSFKINDHHAPFCARKLARLDSRFSDFFELRGRQENTDIYGATETIPLAL